MIDYIKENQKLKTFAENRRTFVLKNKNEAQFGYKKGEDTSKTEERCDYIICYDFKQDTLQFYLLVELKGSNNEKALSQIESTYNFLKKTGEITSQNVICFIVTGSSPSTTSKVQITKKKLMSKFGITIQFKTNKAEYEIK